ncbi:nuclear transport factor 2 family protein [Flagellimonas sp. CMM7]|uniref:nuclear transport factor 2 family protein n=1 Tax=Flagellimonas sp. CMM7 TaxID=2654676 RepID=UPI0013D8573D|nr:nuclear transport factor 2 family protein [Flagellimonas sp. CMM7]UII79107.1 nuclear transport factor 2 family protein [Flagellimonas sp. CMM7]
MTNRLLISCLTLICTTIKGQVNTDVYLFDLKIVNENPVLSNPKNISNNEGYDNQPSFLNDNTVLFSANREDQTDILRFNILEGSTTSWISNTPTGSEYSPLKIPGKKAVSAIRLDLDGLQRLYEYDINTGDSKLILEDLKVGYHLWYNDHTLVTTVLVENRMDLVVINLEDNTNYTFQKNVGRSLWKIPNSDLISYISKENNAWEIKSLNPISGATKKITNTFKESEDICWLNDTTIVAGAGKSLIKFDTESGIEWELIANFEQEEINNITRIAINKAGNRLAFVAEESPANIVQKQLDAYNARDIEAFMDTYSKNIKLYEYPDTLFMEGQEKMKESYGSYFENTPDLHCELKSRIIIGNRVIDEEYITANGVNFRAVAIYEVENGRIIKATFLQ